MMKLMRIVMLPLTKSGLMGVSMASLCIISMWAETHICSAQSGDMGNRLFSIKEISSHEENDMNPVFSPDGKKLAYVRSSATKTEIWILDLETQQEKPVQVSLESAQSAQFLEEEESQFGLELSWAPNSRLFVFVGQGMNLYLGCVDMDRAFQLTNAPEADAEPKWSPDGKYIVFVSGRTGNGDIYLIKIEEILNDLARKYGVRSSRTRGSASASSGFPLYQRVVRGDSGDLNLVEAVESQLRQKGANLTPNSPGIDYAPSWSPDSDAVVYHSHSRNPYRSTGVETFNIWIRRLDKSEPELFTGWTGIVNPMSGTESHEVRLNEMHPSWSPDGQYIAFYSSINLFESDMVLRNILGERQFTLYVVELKTKLDRNHDPSRYSFSYAAKNRLLPENVLVNVDVESGPAWLPGSNGILYTERNALEKDPIYLANIGSKKPRRVDLNTKMNSDVTACSDGVKIAFTAQEDARDCLYIAVIDFSK